MIKIVKQKSVGFTLVELLVVLLILSGLCYALYRIVVGARLTRAIANAKGTAKAEVESALRHLTRDISMARAPSTAEIEAGKKAVDTSGANRISMKVGESSGDVNVTYTWDYSTGKLTRTAGGVSKDVCSFLKFLDVSYNGEASGSITIQIETEVLPEGSKKPEKHRQEARVTVQEEAGSVDLRWKKSEDLSSSF